jgi:multisubunit Na+/H+ antiporter MnhF subunit
VNGWLIGATILLVATAAPLWIVFRTGMMDALVGLELATTLFTLAVALLAEGLHRQSVFDLALVLAVLGFIGSLAFARFLERWV